ncbi:MAG: M3 family metallopeptidase [Pseudomonadales bacterium]|nr:M3 family metallopeptidase [Pseudomonadales bacterium]
MPQFSFPDFSHLVPEQQGEQFLLLLERCKLQWDTLAAAPASFATAIRPLLDMQADLEETFAPISHMNAVMNSPAWRESYQSVVMAWSTYSTDLLQHEGMYHQVQCVLQNSDLTREQRQALIWLELEFSLTGVGLRQDKKIRFAEIMQRLAWLQNQFSEHVLDATQAFSLLVEAEQLRGLPASCCEVLKAQAQAAGEPGYLLSLREPDYLAVMTYGEDRALRQQMYLAQVTRASEYGPEERDNGPVLLEILRLRQEQASLLGFAHYADLALCGRMAGSVREIDQLLEGLLQRSTAAAMRERSALEQEAQLCGLDELQAWDMAFLSERIKQREHAFSQEALRKYFPVPGLLKRLFCLLKELWGIDVREAEAPLWHPEVQYFEVYEQEQVIAGFYLDLFARENKRGGAWMADLCGRRRYEDGSLQKPIALLTCNFAAPDAQGVARLTHAELTTLLHELGHGLQHMLTRIDLPSINGIAHVAWDAVELPSQFMEYLAYREEGLKALVVSDAQGHGMPEDIMHHVVESRRFQAALQTRRQLEFAWFDLACHQHCPDSQAEVQEMLNTVRARVSLIQVPVFNRFQHGFSHIFSGGYAAGYYSYKWAEVLAADAFTAVESQGEINAVMAKRYRDTVLALGGSLPAAQVFEQFLGRAPEVTALLRDYGWEGTA